MSSLELIYFNKNGLLKEIRYYSKKNIFLKKNLMVFSLGLAVRWLKQIIILFLHYLELKTNHIHMRVDGSGALWIKKIPIES